MTITKKKRKRKKKAPKVENAGKLKLRAAAKLHKLFQRLAGGSVRRETGPSPFELIDSTIYELQAVCDAKTRKLYKLYKARKVKTGLGDLFRDMQRAGARARTAADNLVNMVVAEHSKLIRGDQQTVGRSIPVPTERDLVDDLDAIEKYFGNWKVTNDAFIVTTEAIVLHDFDFGKFEIHLLFTGDRRFFLKPLTPTYVDDHPHPHIGAGGELCEGDARRPIEHALGNGLLHEFFMIVQNTLTNYNVHSPFVEIEAWIDGDRYDRHCGDCGCGVHEDDGYYCEHCGEIVCDGCGAYCDAASVSLCLRCQRAARNNITGSSCSGCNQLGAEECLLHVNPPCISCGTIYPDAEVGKCEATGAVICHDCLSDMAERHKPCDRGMLARRLMPDVMRKMGRRGDGICTLVCSNTRASATEAQKCLLRRNGYVHTPEKPSKADNGGTGGT